MNPPIKVYVNEEQMRALARELIASIPGSVKLPSREWQLIEERFYQVIKGDLTHEPD